MDEASLSSPPARFAALPRSRWRRAEEKRQASLGNPARGRWRREMTSSDAVRTAGSPHRPSSPLLIFSPGGARLRLEPCPLVEPSRWFPKHLSRLCPSPLAQMSFPLRTGCRLRKCLYPVSSGTHWMALSHYRCLKLYRARRFEWAPCIITCPHGVHELVDVKTLATGSSNRPPCTCRTSRPCVCALVGLQTIATQETLTAQAALE